MVIDRNGDGFLSMKEFLYLSSKLILFSLELAIYFSLSLADLNFDDSERSYLRERREEFINIDRNQDNILDAEELKVRLF